MKCIYCFEKMIISLSWENIIIGSKQKKLCLSCIKFFERLTNPLCTICSTESSSDKCFDCLEWAKKYTNQDILTKNYSLFKYNDFAQAYLTKWKYQGDFILIDGIEELIGSYKQEKLNFLDKTYKIIPIPLSKERLEERAFNQATLIGNLLGDVDESLLIRQNNDKQSKKTKQERINSSNPFKVTRKITENILLVDDIYTTGSTLRHAAKLLKENGAKEVKSFTLIRS